MPPLSQKTIRELNAVVDREREHRGLGNISWDILAIHCWTTDIEFSSWLYRAISHYKALARREMFRVV